MAKNTTAMGPLRALWSGFLDLCFPKKEEAVRLEALDAAALRGMLPRANGTALPNDIRPLFDYSHELSRELVWEIKYRRNLALAESAAELLAEEMLAELSDRAAFGLALPPLVVPVPQSAERRRERGFNQTELLAKLAHGKWLRDHALYAPNAVAKVRHTPPQTSLDREKRLENLKGAFSVTNPALVRGRHVILIDDVVTTGATVEEIRRTLLEAGAKEVIAFAISH